MTTLLTILAFVMVATGPMMPVEPGQVGLAFHYAKSWDDCTDDHCWETIAAHHGVEVPADGSILIAIPDCDHIGHTGWLWLRNDPIPIRVVVCDCAAPWDRDMIEERGIIAEIPYSVAKDYGFLDSGKASARLWLDHREVQDDVDRGSKGSSVQGRVRSANRAALRWR